jgi:hypothetical protein
MKEQEFKELVNHISMQEFQQIVDVVQDIL